jgi:hypothetical protein
MDGHHLIMGKLADFITGETLNDTHDERYRQKIAKLLVEARGFKRNEIAPRHELIVKAGDKKAAICVDFVITLSEKICMIVKYGPGSVVTRVRPSLSVSRLVSGYQVPVVVITNGEDAEIVDGSKGTVMGRGLESTPSRSTLMKEFHEYSFEPISAGRVEMESRIAYAFEVDDSCPCDDSICRI